MPAGDLIILIVLGLVAGVLGGLLGIGGSIVMIPVLTLLLDRSQHLSQASAMIVNFFVSAPAVYQHHRQRAVRWDIVRRMLPAALVAIVLGVELSNRLDGKMLERTFGLFLIYVIIVNVRKLLQKPVVRDNGDNGAGWAGPSTAGGVTGFAAGVLGIGGGIIAVPLLQRLCHLRLRQCISCSAAVMCVTSVIGAFRKNMALGDIDPGLQVSESVLIALCLAPTAMIGSMFGARLTHSLPLGIVRGVLVVLLTIACVKFLT